MIINRPLPEIVSTVLVGAEGRDSDLLSCLQVVQEAPGVQLGPAITWGGAGFAAM